MVTTDEDRVLRGGWTRHTDQIAEITGLAVVMTL